MTESRLPSPFRVPRDTRRRYVSDGPASLPLRRDWLPCLGRLCVAEAVYWGRGRQSESRFFLVKEITKSTLYKKIVSPNLFLVIKSP